METRNTNLAELLAERMAEAQIEKERRDRERMVDMFQRMIELLRTQNEDFRVQNEDLRARIKELRFENESLNIQIIFQCRKKEANHD